MLVYKEWPWQPSGLPQMIVFQGRNPFLFAKISTSVWSNWDRRCWKGAQASQLSRVYNQAEAALESTNWGMDRCHMACPLYVMLGGKGGKQHVILRHAQHRFVLQTKQTKPKKPVTQGCRCRTPFM